MDRKKFKYHSTHHRIVLNKDSSFAWDSYLIIFSAALDIKEVKVLNQIVQDGKWYTMSQIKKLQYQWPEVEIATSKIHKESFYEYKILPK